MSENAANPHFFMIVHTFAMQALLFSGEISDPSTGKSEINTDMARLHVSFLEALEEKTRGNLDDTERKMLDNALHESRMACVRAMNKTDKPGDEGATGQQPPSEPETPPEAAPVPPADNQ
ncbi:MAG: DUF1844 domain-containing protein [bacterium]|nr:DUF1844 domain-containing protein [Candidatus Sumerlaeota bacterium]